MNKSTLYVIIISILLVCNGIFVYLFLAKPDHPPYREPKYIIIEKLHFSDAQIEAYNELIQWHRSEIVAQEENLRSLKDQLYGLLLVDHPEEEVEKLSQQIGDIHVAIERINFQHFNDLHELCTPEQEEYFTELVKELSKIFAPHHPPKKKK